METKKHKETMERIRKHGEDLKRIFGLSDDPIKLCKKLRRLELAANAMMVKYCNGEIDFDTLQAYELEDLKPKLEKILGTKAVVSMVYINQDPRGYTLKLNEVVSNRSEIHKDWGGYGILAPDLK